MSKCFLLFFQIFPVLLSIGQTNPALTNFSVQQIDNSISIAWTVKAGFSCTDVNVEYSTDSVNFFPIYTYPGVCGATSEDQDYDFVQESPSSNKKNFYRMNLGNYGLSQVLSVYYANYGAKGFSIIPNPIAGAGTLKFYNPRNASFNFEVYNSSGVFVHFQEISGDEIELSSTQFEGGGYFFRLYNSKNSFSGRFSVIY